MVSLLSSIYYYIFPIMIVVIGVILDKYGYLSNIGFSYKYYWILVGILLFYYFITLMVSYNSENKDTNSGDKNLPICN